MNGSRSTPDWLKQHGQYRIGCLLPAVSSKNRAAPGTLRISKFLADFRVSAMISLYEIATVFCGFNSQRQTIAEFVSNWDSPAERLSA